MSLNSTPNANRVHIAFFGRRNAGKSSLLNAVTGQDIAIVSDVKGTTTDPVSKAMELLPIGPVLMIDTPGLDDEGTVGELRIKKARQVLNKTDIALLVVDSAEGLSAVDREIIELFRAKKLPYLVVYNKSDLADANLTGENEISVSSVTGERINELKDRIAALAKSDENAARIVGDLLSPSDVVILVTPIDSSAPKGRMILPQVQTIRDILDSHAMCMVVQAEQLPQALAALSAPPRLVVTDSQVFGRVKEMVAEDIPLTSFSILMARFKGFLETAVRGAAHIESLRDGDVVLISEGCTHHRQCEDIGTVKLPGWIKKHTGRELQFEFTSGGGFPEDISSDKYAMIVHCGGCMLTEREMQYRMRCAEDAGVAFTNYGTLIAYMNGILKRSVAGVGIKM
ncbi:MAG: [FeFe] hydrogenase H-cluster maturation GTPase HydF [Ruminococcaceae bacterium]|nr:[FeFe] hydrogenase H-cluster maturation GTPase HydF [Oscillospiraceae bacterium]